MDEYVTIVSGLPRSGTSMMMRMLEAGGMPALVDNIRQADEDNPRGYYEFERVKQGTEWVPEAQGKVVKMVYRLLYDLPREFTYRVVFMRRKLEEVVRSQEVMLERAGKGGGDVPPERLVAVYQKQLGEVMGWLSNQPNFEVEYVEYDDVLNQPRAVAERLNAFLGGSLNVDAMAAVPEPALHRQRA